MMTCRRAAELISRALDARMPFGLRAGLGYHTLVCRSCRRYRRQLRVIDAAAEVILSTRTRGGPGVTLPPESRERLKAVVSSRMAGEP